MSADADIPEGDREMMCKRAKKDMSGCGDEGYARGRSMMLNTRTSEEGYLLTCYPHPHPHPHPSFSSSSCSSCRASAN
eukprot:6069200-Pyramimonas_sp.AAC.1